MVAPERQRQGLGEVLFRTWDRNVGASLGLGLSESSLPAVPEAALAGRRPGALPGQAADAARAAPPELAGRRQSPGLGADAAARARSSSRTRPLRAEVRLIQRFDDSFTELWDELAPKFDFAVRRDAAYLNWKFVVGAARPLLDRGAAPRRSQRRLRGLPPPPRAARPGDAARRLPRRSRRRGGRSARCSHWVDREARQADSDKIRTFAMHAGFRSVLQARRLLPGEVDDGVRRQGQRRRRRRRRSTTNTDRWHVTLGDSDQDR